MRRSHTVQEALDLNSEIVALSTVLRTWPRCDGKTGTCGRLSTKYDHCYGLAPMCDACVSTLQEAAAANPGWVCGDWKDMAGANRARRLEALLTGEP